MNVERRNAHLLWQKEDMQIPSPWWCPLQSPAVPFQICCPFPLLLRKYFFLCTARTHVSNVSSAALSILSGCLWSLDWSVGNSNRTTFNIKISHKQDWFNSNISGLLSSSMVNMMIVLTESTNSFEQKKQTHRRIFIIFVKKPTWKTGFASSMCPKWPGHSVMLPEGTKKTWLHHQVMPSDKNSSPSNNRLLLRFQWINKTCSTWNANVTLYLHMSDIFPFVLWPLVLGP